MTVPSATTRDRILTLLCAHPGSFLSGEQISQDLQISRAAVWKQIKGLRDLGLIIEAQHARGYRLVGAPDLLLCSDLRQGLDSRIIGHSLEILPQTDSTNLQMKKRAEAGAAEGAVIVADLQQAGKGRLGRHWHSPAGVNLYLSVLLRPGIPVQQAPQLTFLSAVAVAVTLDEVCGQSAVVKWPNDILVGGAKIAGLLNEMDAETERINFVVLGIGINLNMTAELFPTNLTYPATSVLLETGQSVDRVAFLRVLLKRLDQYYCEFLEQGFAPIRQRWEQLCPIVNQRVVVSGGKTLIEGLVVGLEADGGLRLQRDNGEIERIVAGDVRLAAKTGEI